MELEVKHLSPYLHYNLKFVFSNIQNPTLSYHLVSVGKIQCGHTLNLKENTEIYYVQKKYIKPILRPLSDLTKEIEVNGEKFVPFKWFNFINSDIDFETQIIALSNDIRWLNSTYYVIIEKLFEWHFDVFGLIEKGLAIDINTLKQQ
jgi:hypothetical protein